MTEHEWAKVSAVAGPAAVVGLAAGFASGFLGRKYSTFGEWVRSLFAAIFVAVLTALLIEDVGWPLTLRTAVVGLGAFLAPDIVEGLIQLSTLIKRDPIGFYRRIRAAIAGAPDEPPPPPKGQ